MKLHGRSFRPLEPGVFERRHSPSREGAVILDRKNLRNRILALLSQSDFELLEPHLEFVALPRSTVLVSPDVTGDVAYFIESGLASQVASKSGTKQLEVGIFGREAVGPTSVVLGVAQSPHLHIMQASGAGYRISGDVLRRAMAKSETLNGLLLRYVQALIVQMGATAVCNGSSVLGERLARWLLMSHDRLDGNDLPITHQFLGIMLGVRRAGVTNALHILDDMGVIRARRGLIQIVDREKLAAAAGDSYGVPEAEYRRLIDPAWPPRRQP
jgi:CRP-like cAMP-binding protein